jgi:hypothetical protein
VTSFLSADKNNAFSLATFNEPHGIWTKKSPSEWIKNNLLVSHAALDFLI